MPQLRPFRGIRYAPMGPLKEIVCPPYDVISPDEQVRLHERHPYNAVRIELPFSESNTPAERYARAAAQFRAWLEAGVLVPDDVASLYVYRQDYVSPDGARKRVAGVVGALDLEEFGAGVFPHERTMPGPIEDRLALLRACPVNISPIYAIYRGGGDLVAYIDSLDGRPPDARFVDDAGILHRFWAVAARAETEMISAALASRVLVIADGHHRYETALAYHAEQDGSPGGHDAVMCFCVDADAEDLLVLPFHRVLKAGTGINRVAERIRDRFTAPDADHSMVVVLPDGDIRARIGRAEVEARLPGRPDPWLSLDVVALHEVLIPELFPGGIHDLTFTKDEAEVRRLVADGWSAGVLLHPPHAADVIDVARSGERMPQKASYFWPKAVTGLVFRSLR